MIVLFSNAGYVFSGGPVPFVQTFWKAEEEMNRESAGNPSTTSSFTENTNFNKDSNGDEQLHYIWENHLFNWNDSLQTFLFLPAKLLLITDFIWQYFAHLQH